MVSRETACKYFILISQYSFLTRTIVIRMMKKRRLQADTQNLDTHSHLHKEMKNPNSEHDQNKLKLKTRIFLHSKTKSESSLFSQLMS